MRETGGGCVERGGHSTIQILQPACQVNFRAGMQNKRLNSIKMTTQATISAPPACVYAPICNTDRDASFG